MGLIGILAKVVVLVVLSVVALGAYLYFTDYEAEATVTEKGRDANGDYVVLRPKVIPRDFKHHLDGSAASFVCEGYGVTYRIQTGHYVVRDAEGDLVYDSDTGLGNTALLKTCGALGL